MKTKLGILTMSLLMISLFTVAAKEKETSLINGQSLTELGQYSIRLSHETLKFGDEALKTYELTYANSNSPVLIGVKKTKNCMSFIVHTDKIEVEYVCNKHVFGVKRIEQAYQTIPTDAINKMMDNADFYTQRVISQYPKTEEELLGLIACYFPSLVQDQYLSQL